MALCMRKNALLGRSSARSSVARSRVVSVNAYQVTLKTPSGTQTIECADDMYILVSRSTGAFFDIGADCRQTNRNISYLCQYSILFEILRLQNLYRCPKFMCRMLPRRLAWTCHTAAVQV